MKEFNSIEEMQPYYDDEENLFYIKDDIKLNFNLECSWKIKAWNIIARDITANDIIAWDIIACNIEAENIDACNIDARNIKAWDIKAWDIKAWDISYYAVCFAYNNIKCKSIKGRRDNCKHFVLDGEIIIKEEK